MIYLDSSCLLKLLRLEPESTAVAEQVEKESHVIVSSLCELEAAVQLKAGYLGGEYTLAQWRKLERLLEDLLNEDPFLFRAVPGTAWEMAFRQHRRPDSVHCRTLDRLHLAIMESLGATRLMTHDEAQAKAATELGFQVMRPGSGAS